MVRALAKETLPTVSAKNRFEKIAKRILVLAKDRNNVVHALWGRVDNTVAIRMKFTGWGEVKFINARMTATDIEAIASDISHATGNLYRFLLDFGLIRNEPT